MYKQKSYRVLFATQLRLKWVLLLHRNTKITTLACPQAPLVGAYSYEDVKCSEGAHSTSPQHLLLHNRATMYKNKFTQALILCQVCSARIYPMAVPTKEQKYLFGSTFNKGRIGCSKSMFFISQCLAEVYTQEKPHSNIECL